jgi:hypothetical protein
MTKNSMRELVFMLLTLMLSVPAAIGILVLFSLSGCHQVTEVPSVGKTTADYNRDRVIVYVHWTADIDKIGKACDQPSDYGCAQSQQLGPEDWKCDVYAQRPTDFNDKARLQVVGHELLHCLGGQHALQP